jgi:DNA-binding IscR family transcriptional regulator
MNVQLQRASDLALRLLRALDGNARLASADKVADEIASTIDMVRQVVRPLVAAGWVESHRVP